MRLIRIVKILVLSTQLILQSQADDPGEPLILTPMLEQNRTEDALIASSVHFDGFKGVKSYAGYFTVNKEFNSNTFFWFFPSEGDYQNDPVLLWLQGGPGSTSMVGLFLENGPFKVKSKHGLDLRTYSWTKTHSVIYMDNPVGTGYSFTDEGGYATNQTQIGEQLYIALRQFFQMFPELLQNDFFVSGESYGGKYVPALAYQIHQKNSEDNLKINLQGLAIGNGLTDPINQIELGEYYYNLGLLDDHGLTAFNDLAQEIANLIEEKSYDKASEIFLKALHFFMDVTGYQYLYNYLYTTDPRFDLDYMYKYIQRDDIRAAIHVGNAQFNNKTIVRQHLKHDLVQSVAPWMSELLEYYRVLLYSGQLDLAVPYVSTTNYLKKLNFSSAEEYKMAQRNFWKIDDVLAGYVKEAGNLTEVLVRDAGHLVPYDQAKAAYVLINSFTRNKKLC